MPAFETSSPIEITLLMSCRKLECGDPALAEIPTSKVVEDFVDSVITAKTARATIRRLVSRGLVVATEPLDSSDSQFKLTPDGVAESDKILKWMAWCKDRPEVQ